jgi:hypothetical protein
LVDGGAVQLDLRSGGSVPTAQFTRLGQASLTGVSVTFNALTNLDNTSLYAYGGAVLSVPGVGSANGSMTWQADGTGSRISLPGLTKLTSTGSWIQPYASNGGRVELGAVQAISGG